MLSLFPIDSSEKIKLIEKDGLVEYMPICFSSQESEHYLMKLVETIPWQHDVIQLFGKTIHTKRKVAWFGSEAFQYTYSGNTKTALIWTKELLEIKKVIEKLTGESFNSCLLNLYHNGEEAMGWHADNEKDLKENGTIASVSFGVTRKFSLRHTNSKEIVSVDLENGSLLLMKNEIQKHWVHRLHPSKKIKQMRINLTFRTIVT